MEERAGRGDKVKNEGSGPFYRDTATLPSIGKMRGCFKQSRPKSSGDQEHLIVLTILSIGSTTVILICMTVGGMGDPITPYQKVSIFITEVDLITSYIC